MNARTIFRRTTVAALPLALGACSWFTDFRQQPSVGTWQVFTSDSAETKGFRGSPRGSVSINGTMMPEWQVSYAQMPATIDSMSSLANPVAADLASVQRGRRYYQINCAVCHGRAGLGDGTATKLGMVPMPLTSDRAKAYTDGYLWGMMRNGRGLMPSANRIEEMDRWDVVNYVRALRALPYIADHGRPAGRNPATNCLRPTRPSVYARFPVIASPRAIRPASESKNEGHQP